jgi:D-alanine-D-alanine ligase
MNSPKRQAVLLYDAQAEETVSPDQRDALVQAEAIGTALGELGWESMRLGFSLDFKTVMEALADAAPAFVFNLVESVGGQGRLIFLAPTLLEVLGIPYTGSGTDALYLTSNKMLAKRIMTAQGLPTPKAFSFQEAAAAAVHPLEGEYIVKSIWEHASLGLDENAILRPVDSRALSDAIRARSEDSGGEWFAEAFVEGREFNISLLAGERGPEVLPHAEIRFEAFPPGKRRLVDYRAKWEEDSFEFQNTPRCFDFPPGDRGLLDRLSDLSLRCWRIFDLRGYARVDFRVDASGRPWILEVNANPCLSPDAGLAAAAARAGLSFAVVISRIVQDMNKRISWDI